MDQQSSFVPSVLFVDDEPSILSALKRLFRPEGYNIYTAESGALALDLVKSHHMDVVVSDMRMPGMDGAALFEVLRKGWPNIIRILLTGYADVNSTIAAINKGEIHKYISKPIDDQSMLLTIREAVQRARLQEENLRLWMLTNEQNEELKALNEQLEARVTARTREIEQVNAMLEHSLRQMNENYLTSIQMFSGLLELREGSDAGHSGKVATLAKRMAIQLKLDSRTVEDVYIAGLLQNIGMIGFPDQLYRKPLHTMNGEELKKFKKHPITAENILLPLQQLRKISKYIRWQHERLDGNGYPDGLSEGEIPVPAQIIGLADDYLNLIQGRLSDNAHTPDKAIQVIRQGTNTRYGPTIVAAFEAVVDLQDDADANIQEVSVKELQPDMVLAKDLLSPRGTLLLAAGFVFEARVISQLKEIADREAFNIKLRVIKQPGQSEPHCSLQ